MIEEVLIEKLSDSNVCNFANAAVKFNAHNLKDHCTCYIIDALKKFKILDGIHHLHASVKIEVFDRTLITFSEYAH